MDWLLAASPWFRRAANGLELTAADFDSRSQAVAAVADRLCREVVLPELRKRVAALLLVYFLAVLVFALIERKARLSMKKREIESLPLHPEDGPCTAPTTDGILSAFLGLRRTRLIAPGGAVVRTFHDPLRPVVAQLLKLLGVSRQVYRS